MTNEEARKIIMCDFEIGTQKTADALVTAVEALEKQIPKKPWHQADDDTCLYYHWECVTCGEELIGKPHHCVCGQALDWSDEE